MVERINKPDARRPYKITEAKESREDQHHQQNPKEDEEKRYKKKLEGKEWGKYGSRAVVVKPYRVGRDRIKICLFRSVSLRSGVGTLDAQITWTDGRITKQALILLRTLDDFMSLKKLKQGAPVPEDIWGRDEIIEIGIPQVIDSSLPGNSNEIGGGEAPNKRSVVTRAKWLSTLGLVEQSSQNIRWKMLLLYLLILTFIAIALFL